MTAGDGRPVRPFFLPPTLLVRQAASALLAGRLTGWRHTLRWMVRHGRRCARGAAGSPGMGCIGFPNHPVWEVTARCNLDCIHCHARGSPRAGPELSTGEGKKLISDLATVPEFRMCAFTGGEPLVREDIFELLAYAHGLGFSCTIATNGTLVDRDCAIRLRDCGVAIAAVSLDGCSAGTHDAVRGVKGAFEGAIEGIHALHRAGIPIHINITAMTRNLGEIPAIVELVDGLDAAIILVYQLVPIGRGEKIGDFALGAEANGQLVRFMAEAQQSSRAIIEPVAAPQYFAYILDRNGITGGMALRLAGSLFHGCSAGRGFVYIRPDGTVVPCPFLPVPCGNVRERPFSEIWRESPVLERLRGRETSLKGKCGSCPFRTVCGGCRARAYAATGDFLQEDPSCFMGTPGGGRNGTS